MPPSEITVLSVICVSALGKPIMLASKADKAPLDHLRGGPGHPRWSSPGARGGMSAMKGPAAGLGSTPAAKRSSASAFRSSVGRCPHRARSSRSWRPRYNDQSHRNGLYNLPRHPSQLASSLLVHSLSAPPAPARSRGPPRAKYLRYGRLPKNASFSRLKTLS